MSGRVDPLHARGQTPKPFPCELIRTTAVNNILCFQRSYSLGHPELFGSVIVIGDVVLDISYPVEENRRCQCHCGPAEAPGDAADSPQLLLTLRLFGSSGRLLCVFARIEEFHCQAKLGVTAMAFRPGLVWGLPLLPSDGVCEVWTAPQLGIALFPP